MTWKDYEHYIHQVFSDLYPEATITHNVQKIGVISRTKRQIDVLIEGYLAGYSLNIVVDCKYFNKKVDVKVVESFISFLHDVKANKGILITNRGFTQAAQARAQNDSHVDLDLRIIEFDKLQDFQGFGGIPYREPAGIIIQPPNGWILDGQQRHPSILATVYPKGLSFEKAIEVYQYMHVYITIKTDVHPDLESLFKYQEGYTRKREHSSNCTIEYFPKAIRDDAESVLRVITFPEYNLKDCTLFVDFEDFIFYCTLVTPNSVLNKPQGKNLKLLEQMMGKAIPLQVKVLGSEPFEGFQRT